MSPVSDALKQYWPDLPERKWFGFLLCATSYPFGTHRRVCVELEDLAERTNSNPELAMAIAAEELDAAMANRKETRR